MTVVAFEGAAGSGKTHRLMEELADAVRRRPLAEHERVLALTFMHGSRRRLDARLREIDTLAGQFTATTIDSFAWRITQRWRRLARQYGHAIPSSGEYDKTCAVATALLDNQSVQAWTAVSYPFVVVDEAQDLSPERSALIQKMTESTTALLAYDEFQCLDLRHIPIAIEEWIRDRCEPVLLEGCRRTDQAGLLESAQSIRAGRSVPTKRQGFRVAATPGKYQAATWLSNAIAWRNGGNVAVLTPSRRGGFAEDVVELVRTTKRGKQQNGPFPIEWENPDDHDRDKLWDRLGINGPLSASEVLAVLAQHRREPAVKSLIAWVKRQRSTQGKHEFSADELIEQLGRILSLRRRHGQRTSAAFSAMTIHQAKNREFDHVIVVWPHTVLSDDDKRRRLLYNAVTRARISCKVLVQSENMLAESPFSGTDR